MKKTTIAIVLLASLNNIFGQGNQSQYDPSVKNVPTSPEVALLGRFGDIPVGHYTGTAEVSVPLYNLKVDNIEIPLALSYHTSGIKVADEATWVGLGWNFMPEGTITQEIRGREEFVSGGDGFSNSAGYNLFKSYFPTLASQNQLYRLQNGFVNYNTGSSVYVSGNDDSEYVINNLLEGKGQPDIFTYNFYGYSGKFFFNPENSNEILFMESNDDVKFSRTSAGWVAKTNKGDKFYFHIIEKSYSAGAGSAVDIGYTFKISKIELVSGKIINFTYQDESTNQLYPIETARLINFDGSISSQVRTNTNAVINEKKTLIGIETEDTKIDFNLSDRDDIRPLFPTIPVKKLISIDIKSKYPNKKIKSFSLGTSYFNNDAGTGEFGYKNKRLKLDTVQEINYDDSGNPVQNVPPYTFEYDMTKTMPSKVSSSDFYGYNNGSNSTSLLPDLLFFDFLNQAPYKNYNLNVQYPYGGTSRYTNIDYITTNILKKVTYPTGARTEFDYESNIFTNQFVPAANQLETPYKSVDLNHRGASVTPGGYYFVKSQPFKLHGTTTLRFRHTIYDGYLGPNYPEYHYDFYQMLTCKIQFHKTQIVNGQPVDTIIKEWKVSGLLSYFEQTHQQSWDEFTPEPYDSNPTTEYYLYVENGIQYNSNDGIHRAIVTGRIDYYDDSQIDHSFSYGSGVRVKSIKNYENNTLLSHKTYSYNGGKLIYGFKPLNLIQGATYKSQPSNLSLGCGNETVSIFNDLSVNSNDFGISGSKPFGYDEVIEKDINVFDGTTKGSTKYNFSNNDSMGTVIKGFPNIDVPSNGENTSILKYDPNNVMLSSTINIYDNLPNTYGVYPSFGIVNSSTGPYDPAFGQYPYQTNSCGTYGTSYTGHTSSNPLPTKKYRFIFNPLITGKRRLTKTIDTSYLNGKSMVEQTDLSYTDSGELDISTTTTSEGKVITTDYDYADDVNNTRLVNKGMTGIPLSIEVNSGSTQVSHVETKYDNLNNYLPSSVVSSTIGVSNMDTEVTYDKYDAKGNLLQYTRKDGIPVSLIWGYHGTKPIAKIEGMSYDLAMALVGVSDIITQSELDVSAVTETTFINVLDTFRKNNVRQFITTYTYDPLIGVTSITPPSGIREIYKYDSANRLYQVVDVNGKLLKEYTYHYKN